MKLERAIAFLDAESTGCDPCADYLVELAVVVVEPDLSRRSWVQRFRPPIPIPAEATAIHGIADADVAECPPFSEWATRIRAGLQGKDLAGFNLKSYDLVLIDEELRRAGLKLNLDGVRVIDCFSIFRKKEPRKLADAVRRYCCREHEDAHGALADAVATADVLAGQLSVYPDLAEMSLDELAEFSKMNEGQEADLAGKLYYDAAGVLRFAFGKHKDKPVLENMGYVNWMLGADFPGSTCDLLRRVAGWDRTTEPEPDESWRDIGGDFEKGEGAGKSTKRLIALGSLLAVSALALALCFGQTKTTARRVPGESYINAQLKIIQKRAAILVEQGRMPVDFGDEFMVLGQYGWHTPGGSEVGPRASLSLLQSGDGSAFGAYTFYQPAFEQAKRSWWIHGVMEKGSNVLHAMNLNAKFDESVIGYSVSGMYKVPSGAKVVGLFKYDDGSVDHHTLILDKPSPEFSMQYGMSILPPDYVDMCACSL